MNKRENKKTSLLLRIWHARYLYLLLLPALIWIIVFAYGPMYGIILAFKDYKANLGIWGSPWVGLYNFKRIFVLKDSVNAILNTIWISFGRIIFEFPAPIILALMITEFPGKGMKRICQTVLTFPHFLSWVIVALVLNNTLGYSGPVNVLLRELGLQTVNVFGENELFRPLLYATDVWKEAGWSCIIYIATISGVDPSLYEAAKVDGASRIKQIWHITLSSIKPIIMIMLILKIGGIMNSGFEQIQVLRNALVADAARTIDTYVHDITFLARPNYGFSTAVGLFKNIINVTLVLLANKVSDRMTGNALFR